MAFPFPYTLLSPPNVARLALTTPVAEPVGLLNFPRIFVPGVATFPLAAADEYLDHPALGSPGIYILCGRLSDKHSGSPRTVIYVGEAMNVATRLNRHFTKHEKVQDYDRIAVCVCRDKRFGPTETLAAEKLITAQMVARGNVDVRNRSARASSVVDPAVVAFVNLGLAALATLGFNLTEGPMFSPGKFGSADRVGMPEAVEWLQPRDTMIAGDLPSSAAHGANPYNWVWKPATTMTNDIPAAGSYSQESHAGGFNGLPCSEPSEIFDRSGLGVRSQTTADAGIPGLVSGRHASNGHITAEGTARAGQGDASASTARGEWRAETGTFVLHWRGLKATLEADKGRFVIKAGSEVAMQDSEHLAPSAKAQRANLRATGAIKEGAAGRGVFTRDVACPSPSNAAIIVNGSRGGAQLWKRSKIFSPNEPTACLVHGAYSPGLTVTMPFIPHPKRLQTSITAYRVV